MRSWTSIAGVAILMASLAGCGGGGGGSGGGGLATAPMTLKVAINGATATADGNGQYTVKPGDMVEITPSLAADWSTSSAAAGAVTLRKSSVASTKWSAQIVNTTTAQATYTVTAKATLSALLTKDAVLKVSPGDARNAEYKVFATNGSKQVLALNFDTMSYVMTDAAGVAVSDAFSADPVDTSGGYIFSSSRITGKANTARFRLSANTAVGAFPFAIAGVSPEVYAVQPFIASNALVTSQAALVGTYNRLGINLTSSTRDSNIRQVEVTAGGASLLMCNEVAITTTAACPPASVLTYTITPSTTPDSWRITNVADPADTGAFSIARIGGQNVYLSAGIAVTAPGMVVFRVGIEDTAAWPAVAAMVTDTNGAWGTLSLDPTVYTSGILRPDATNGAVAYPVSVFAGPQGIRGVNSAGTDKYFAMQNGKLAVIVGARTGPVAGYMQFGLLN